MRILFNRYKQAGFTRTLGLLLKSEVGIVESLQVVRATSGNSAYRHSFDNLMQGVIHGQTLCETMAKDKLLYPILLTQMIGVSEATGNLSSTLIFLSEMYEDEMNRLTKNLSTSIEPVLMIFMGILVGFIAISIITPIYGITQSLHQ